MKESSDRLRQFHDSIAPLVRQGSLQEVCNIIAAERDRAKTEKRSAEAATLSIMLGSFLSITGRREEGMAAHVFAEEVEPGNPHHALAIARYLLSIMGDPESAAVKTRQTLSRATSSDPKLLHDAYSILGLCAVRSQSYEAALSHLQEAQSVARAHDIAAILWDFALAREVVATSGGHNYLVELLQRAQLENDVITENRVTAILRGVAGSGQP